MKDDRGFVDTHSNQKHFTDRGREGNPGPFIGVVETSIDPLLMGRLGVNIPALTTTTKPDKSQIIWCRYLSPFYGSKPLSAVSTNDLESYKTNQTSYGFWAVPPDVGTEVLVMFAKGENNENSAFWIGCVQQPKVNQQIPGFGSTTRTEKPNARELARSGQTNYETDYLPVGDLNRNFTKGGRTLSNSSKWDLPVNDLLADQLLDQGLVQDDIRGTTSSSAARETPSQVFGINTPGPIRKDSRKLNIGLEGRQVRPDRDLGHSLVMDDGDVNGNNRLTRIRTASGHQLLMHDTQGVVYLANGSGNSWIEMDTDGKMYIYAQDGFNLRCDGNFDLHSGGDINFHAKHNIKFTAEQDLVNNANFVMNVGDNGVLTSSQKGQVQTFGAAGITSHSNGIQAHSGAAGMNLKGARIDMNTGGTQEPGWGPSWLNSQAAGIFLDESQNDVNLTVSKGKVLKANTKKTKTTVPNLVTHEPFTRAPSGVYETVSQWEDPVKWKQLSKTPGTLEYIAQKNRESEVDYIRNLQFFTDQKKYLETQGLIEVKGVDLSVPKEFLNEKLNIDSAKLKEASDFFTSTYNEVYEVKSVVDNLKTGDINQILTSKVVAGKITSMASNLAGTILGRSSANNLPPSMRGTAVGKITQVATAFKGQFTKAATAIGSFFTSKFSDARLKEDIRLVGQSPSGTNVYSFKYKQLPGRYLGVMAQEVPWASHLTDTGYYAVDYSKVDVEFRRLH